MTFKAGVDKKGLRLMSVGMPGTLSLGSVLTGLGVAGADSRGDMLTASATTVLYVPSVANSTGGMGWIAAVLSIVDGAQPCQVAYIKGAAKLLAATEGLLWLALLTCSHNMCVTEWAVLNGLLYIQPVHCLWFDMSCLCWSCGRSGG